MIRPPRARLFSALSAASISAMQKNTALTEARPLQANETAVNALPHVFMGKIQCACGTAGDDGIRSVAPSRLCVEAPAPGQHAVLHANAPE